MVGRISYLGRVKQGNYHTHVLYTISSQSLNLGGRRGTTDVVTIPFHPSLSSAALRESPNPISVHSLMLSSHLFFYLPFLLAPFTVPCRTVFAMPEDLEMWPCHLSFRFFTMVTLRKRLRIRSVISVNFHYTTVLYPFNLLIRFKCYTTV